MTCRRILVMGAGGFVSSPAMAGLLATGPGVGALARSSPHVPGVGFHRADLLDPAAAARVVQDAGAGYLLHLAWNVVSGL